MAERYVTVATFDQPVAATMAKDFLENQGISAILLDEASVATDWLLSNAIGGIKLQVTREHLERAEFLLEKNSLDSGVEDKPVLEFSFASPEQAAQARARQQEIAEDLRAEELDRSPGNLLVDRLFRATVMGFLFLPLQFYASYLLIQAFALFSEISPERRWKLWLSLLFNLPLLGIGLLLLAMVLNW